MAAPMREIQFKSGEDGPLLEGYLHCPDGDGPFPSAVICHPHSLMGGSMDDAIVVSVCRALTENGWVALRFNFRGVGGSAGFFGQGRGEMDDTAGAFAFLGAQDMVDVDRLAIVGYSFGAAVGLRHAARDPRVGWLVGVALTQAHYADSFLDDDERPKLFIVGENDAWAPVEHLRAYVARLSPPKVLKVFTHVDHFFLGRQTEVARAVADFLSSGGSAEAQKKSRG